VPGVAVDRPKQRTDLGRPGNGSEMLDLGHRDRAAKVGRHILVAPNRRDAIAEHAAKDAAHAPCAFVGAGCLDLAKHGKRLMRRDLCDRDGAEQRIGLGEKPTNLVDGHWRETIPLAFDEPFLGDRLEGVSCGIFGGDPRALLVERRIDPVGDLLLGLVAPGARLCEAYGRPATEVKLFLLVEEAVVEAPQLRAIGLDDEIEALRITQGPSLFPRLGGIDLDVCQHGRFPSEAGSIRGQQ